MKTLTKVMATVAMLVVGSASMGCVIYFCDEPQALESMMD